VMNIGDGKTLDAPEGMAHLYPHQLRGEGHFVAMLKKDEGEAEDLFQPAGQQLGMPQKQLVAAYEAFAKPFASLPRANAQLGDALLSAPDTVLHAPSAQSETAETLADTSMPENHPEIVDAARKLAADAASGRMRPDQIDEALVGSRTYAPDLPDPDLIIRTSGEQRVSNFLLWECAYSEFYFTDVLWPDFSRADFDAALASYAERDRRRGGHA